MRFSAWLRCSAIASLVGTIGVACGKTDEDVGSTSLAAKTDNDGGAASGKDKSKDKGSSGSSGGASGTASSLPTGSNGGGSIDAAVETVVLEGGDALPSVADLAIGSDDVGGTSNDGSVEAEVPDASNETVKCKKVEPKDTLISQLVEDSWIAGYPLTRLTITTTGVVTGPALPDLVAGDLEIIHTVPEALSALVTAIADLNSNGRLPDYGIGPITSGGEACAAVSAWTPLGTTTVATKITYVDTNGVNQPSWKKTRAAFSKVCPLVRVKGNKDAIDPPSDGSTNAALDNVSVFASGVRANAFGLCANTTPAGTSCMLSYATGARYLGRWCQPYAGSNRCVLR